MKITLGSDHEVELEFIVLGKRRCRTAFYLEGVFKVKLFFSGCRK